MSDEKQKYQCPCGSLVLKANQKQHEKTKKHLNATGYGNFPVINQLQQHVKESKIKNGFNPIKQDGKITINQFDVTYRKKRRSKNKAQKKSRRLNRG